MIDNFNIKRLQYVTNHSLIQCSRFMPSTFFDILTNICMLLKHLHVCVWLQLIRFEYNLYLHSNIYNTSRMTKIVYFFLMFDKFGQIQKQR